MSHTFTPAEHQLISMDIVYDAEEEVREKNEAESFQDRRDLHYKMLEKYRELLDDKAIEFVEDIPQYFKEKITLTPGFGLLEMELETGFHANAITRGDPKDPDEIIVTFAGTDFFEPMDVDQTFISQNYRQVDYSEKAIDYIRSIKEKYPDAKIVVNGHSMAGKLGIQTGVVFPDVEVYAFNPTALDKKYHALLNEKDHFDNIHVVIYDQDIAELERTFKYLSRFTTTGRLPFHLYHMDPGKSGIPQEKEALTLFDFSIIGQMMYIIEKFHKMKNHHSTGGFLGEDGSLWDPFNMNPIDFSTNSGGTTEIVFDRERYIQFSRLLMNHIIPKLKKAVAALEMMEDDVHNQIRSVVNRAIDQIQHVQVDPHVVYGNPKESAIEALRDAYYKRSRYRCYEAQTLYNLIDVLTDTISQTEQLATGIEKTSEDFVRRELTLIERLYHFDRTGTWLSQ